jgi:hypothetical protein
MYLYLKVVWVAFEKCNPVCLILSLKGHSTYCPNIIIKIFHWGIGQQFIMLISAPSDLSQPSEKASNII